MKWSLYIGKLFGIKIFIHWTFLLLIGWISFLDYSRSKDVFQVLISVVFIISVFVCIILHEIGHALIAQYFHYKTKDITLLPIGGMARMDELPEKPKEELLVSIAGPVVNLLIAAIIYPLIHWFSDIPSFFTTLFVSGENFLYNLFIVNIGLALFNMLPAFPMDGGRIFRAGLSFFMDRLTATNIAVKTGQVMAVLFFFIGIFYNPILTVISILIFLFAQTENDAVRGKYILSNYAVRDVMSKDIHSLSPNDTISDAMKSVLERNADHFLILENNKVIGTIDKKQILKALNTGGIDSIVRLYMNNRVLFFNADTAMDKVYSELYFSENAIFPVIENDLLVGIIDVNTIDEFIVLKNAKKNIPNFFTKKINSVKTEKT